MGARQGKDTRANPMSVVWLGGPSVCGDSAAGIEGQVEGKWGARDASAVAQSCSSERREAHTGAQLGEMLAACTMQH